MFYIWWLKVMSSSHFILFPKHFRAQIWVTTQTPRKRLVTVCKLTFSAHNGSIWWLIFKQCYVINGHILHYHFTPASKKYIPWRLFQRFWVIAGKGWMNKFVNIDQSWHSCYPAEAFLCWFFSPCCFQGFSCVFMIGDKTFRCAF